MPLLSKILPLPRLISGLRVRIRPFLPGQVPRSDIVFALRTTAASFIALYIALALHLEEPQWAMMTVFIVAQPFAGMTLAKGLFRVVGTVAGAVATVAIGALLGAVPALMLSALVVWIALCTFVSGLLRAPVAYGAVLSGYTALLIALPAVAHPSLIREIADARCIEILVGIVCAGLTSRLVLPQRVRPVLLRRLRTCLRDLAGYAATILDGGSVPDTLYRQLVEDSQALAGLRTYARIEAPAKTDYREVRRALGELLSALSAARMLHDHVRPGTDGLDALLRQASAVLRRIATASPDDPIPDTPDPDIARALGQAASAVIAREAALHGGSEQRLHEAAVLAVLSELLDAVGRAQLAYAALVADQPRTGEPGRSARTRAGFAVHRDVPSAARNAVRAAVSTAVLAAAWVLTNWPEGIATVVIVAAVTGLFATLPNPIPSARAFMRGTLWAVVPAFICGQLLLPVLLPHGAAWLVPVMAPALLPAALGMAQPRISLASTAFAIFYVALIGPHASAPLMPLEFAGGAAAALLGQALSILVFRFVLPPSGRRSIRQLTRAMRDGVATLCTTSTPPARLVFESQAYDRVAQLLPHLPDTQLAAATTLRGSLALLRLGLEVLQLRDPRLLEGLPAATRRRVEGVLAGLAILLGRRDDAGHPERLAEAARSTALAIAGTDASPTLIRAAASLRLIAAVLQDHRGFLSPAVRP
ncbi:MAG: FUSC family protein [Acetobacteraceae bacterium]|nr:FUSC family protein [Acetobacteraceae bacterium]